MNDEIICPNCKTAIPLTEALSHQVQEKYQAFFKKRLAEEKAKIEQGERERAEKKVREEMELQFKDKTIEAEELRKEKQKLQDQLLELNKLIRQLRDENEKRRLEMEKQFTEEQEKMRQEEKKRMDDEYRLKMLEKDKKLEDAHKLVEEYKQKLEQGSQQLQGEVLELELEEILKRQFPMDEIKSIAKGVRGADLLQVVKNNYGRVCGTIIWESKRTKSWSNEWLTKLKEDQRVAKAEIAVILSQILPDGISSFGMQQGVWVAKYDLVSGLAIALRAILLEVSLVKLSNVNRQNKMEVLFQYFSGIEFKQRLEAMIEAYSSMQDDIEREKRWFSTKWAKQEKSIRKVFDSLSGMYGDLQGMMGKALPDVKGLEMLPDGESEQIDLNLSTDS